MSVVGGGGEWGPLADTSSGVGGGGEWMASSNRLQKLVAALAVANLKGGTCPPPMPSLHISFARGGLAPTKMEGDGLIHSHSQIRVSKSDSSRQYELDELRSGKIRSILKTKLKRNNCFSVYCLLLLGFFSFSNPLDFYTQEIEEVADFHFPLSPEGLGTI